MVKIYKQEITQFACDESVIIQLSSAYAPNISGIWEAAVESAKHDLKRIAGNTHITVKS